MMFGEFLVSINIIDRAQLEMAVAKQKEIGIMLGETLVNMGIISKDQLEKYLEEHLLCRADDIVREHNHEIIQ